MAIYRILVQFYSQKDTVVSIFKLFFSMNLKRNLLDLMKANNNYV